MVRCTGAGPWAIGVGHFDLVRSHQTPTTTITMTIKMARLT